MTDHNTDDLWATPQSEQRQSLAPRVGASNDSLFGQSPSHMAATSLLSPPDSSEALVVVTGPAGALGRAIRGALCERGVLVAGVGGGGNGALLDGMPVLELDGDLASAEQIDRAAEFVRRVGESLVGMVHVVAPSAGPVAQVGESALDRLDADYLRGLRGPYQLTQRLLASLEAHAGRIVVVHPASSSQPVASLPDSMRAELEQHGVSVCSLAVDSPTTSANDESLRALAKLVVDTLFGEGDIEVTSLRVRLK
jgi:NAD(P)-dependent dehydrogenase (short-subunit alcohol dehydrogenase family)